MALVTVAHMNVFLDLTLGAGLAVAAGLRPFLPAVLAGGLATADLGLDFDRGGWGFLESAPFLIAMAVGFAVMAALERRWGSERLESGPTGAAFNGIALGVGAVLFAGALAQHTSVGWLGLIGGLACAALSQSVERGLLARTRARLSDLAARQALPLYFELAALVMAGVCVLAPPVSLVVLALMAWLALAGRRRESERYAGLRVLR